MNLIRWSVALLLIVIAQIAAPVASAQEGTPDTTYRLSGGIFQPGAGLRLHLMVTNTTDTPIMVSGAGFIDIISPEHCPRHWFGDAGYPDRPRGENETTQPIHCPMFGWMPQ